MNKKSILRDIFCTGNEKKREFFESTKFLLLWFLPNIVCSALYIKWGMY